MNQQEIEKTARNFLIPPTQTGPIVIGILSGLLLLSGLSSMTVDGAVGFGVFLLLLGLGGVAWSVMWFRKNSAARVGVHQMDRLVKLVEEGVRARAPQALNIDPSEVSSVDPLIVSGYNFSDATIVRFGTDGHWRSNVAEAAVIYFADDVLHAYKETISLYRWGTLAARTDTYFYSDVVSVSTETTSSRTSVPPVSYQEFRLTTSGGTSIACGVVLDGRDDRSIQGARSLVMERKRGAQ